MIPYHLTLLGVPGGATTATTIELITFPLAIVISLCASAFAVGGFYLLTNWRLNRLEKSQEQDQETRERIARIETGQQILLTHFQNQSNP